MQTKPAKPAKPQLIFESVPCSRCEGNPAAFAAFGHVNNGRCLLCDGTTHAMTRRGRAAYNWFKDQLEIAQDQIEPGMLVRPARSPDGTRIIGDRIRVESVDGSGDRFVIKGKGHTYHAFHGTRYTLIPSAERRAELIEQALAYQATLTKAGTPRTTPAAA